MSLQGRQRAARIVAAAVLLLLGACATNPPAPVEDLSLGDSRPRPRIVEERPSAAAGAGVERYRVERGDTLYAIAFRHGVDYRDVARWNHIEPPYTIFVGRELRLTPPDGEAKPAVAAVAPRALGPAPTPSAPRTPTQGASAPGAFEPVAPATAAAPANAATSPASPKPAVPPPVAATTAGRPAPATSAPATPAQPPSTVAPPTVAPPAASSTPSAPPPVTKAPAGDVPWRWPADGTVVGTFVAGDLTRQGVDIAGKAGDPVRAAGDGVVVYSGNGLIGYGELIIIKHNPSFLSAYGHNRKRLVQEGDKIKSGQAIAEMGSSGASRDLVHFEIRKNGKPVNPLDYLPSR